MSKIPATGQPVFNFAEECDPGKVRDENQDSVLHVRIPLGELLVVADGMGGYAGGAVASRMVVENFLAHLAALPQDYPPDQAIREASARANASVVTASKAPGSPYQRMGSTVVIALLQQDAAGTRAWIGHIGDSRAYLVRAGRLNRLTVDHSTVEALLNRNLITPEEAVNHPDASVLTRSLGHKAEVEIDVDQYPLAEGDTLLLCSDGLWGFVADNDIQMVAADPDLTTENAAHTLLGLALAAGGQDNIGIEMARLSPARLAAFPAGKFSRFALLSRFGFIETLAICLLAFACLGALAYVAQRGHWLAALHNLPGFLHSTTKDASQPHPAFNFVVVQDQSSEPFDIGGIADPAWAHVDIAPDKEDSCHKLAAAVSRLTIYYKNRAEVEKAVGDNRSIRKHEHEWDKKRIEDGDLIQQQCGDFDMIVLVPRRKADNRDKADNREKPAAQPKPGQRNQASPPAKPSAKTAKPSTDTAKPADDTAKPADDTAKPADDTSKPPAETSKHASEAVTPNASGQTSPDH